jgi:hypothetical protein
MSIPKGEGGPHIIWEPAFSRTENRIHAYSEPGQREISKNSIPNVDDDTVLRHPPQVDQVAPMNSHHGMFLGLAWGSQ